MLEMSIDSKKIEDRLLEFGERLASPPSSVDELYSLLDLIDGLLSTVEQSPSESMLDALKPLMTALAVKEYLRHSNMDVKVAVASCISEITRITAPEAPYDDDIMKEIFQMIVESFTGLDDMSSRSFQKRVSILETVAKVRSCVVMLDLECDALILQMFHHFLKTIRTDHSENIFSSMETIMILVIEESEDISSELISGLLDALKKDNKDVLPMAEKLAEKVIGSCATKLKPYLVKLVKSRGASLSEYNKLVASICQENTNPLDQGETRISHEALADDSKLSEGAGSDELPQVSAKPEQEVGGPKKAGIIEDASSIAAARNANVKMGNGDTMERPSSPKQKSECSDRNGQSKDVASDPADCDNVETSSVKPDGTIVIKKGKGQKTNSSVQLTDSIDQIDNAKDSTVATSKRKGCSKEAGSTKEAGSSKEAESSPVDEVFAQEGKLAVSLEPEKKDGLQCLPRSDEPTSDTFTSPISCPPNSSRPKRGRPPGPNAVAKRSAVHAAASARVQKDPSENSHARAEVLPSKGDDPKEPETADDVEAPAGLTRDSEVKPSGNEGKKVRFKRKVVIQRESSGRKKNSNMKQQKEETAQGEDVDRDSNLEEMASSPKSSMKALSVDETHLEDSVKPKSRRKRPLESEEISETPDHEKKLDKRLVGSRIRVWWPDDKMFYEGIVDSYDSGTMKHKVVYNDGDVEVLLLGGEQWEFVRSDPEKDRGKQKVKGSASQMPQNKKARGSSNMTSKHADSQAKFKSGTESSSKDVPRPRGRPKRGTSDFRKLSYDDAPETSKKSKGKSAGNDKEKTMRSSRKLKDEPENEAKDAIPRASSKREESVTMSKGVTSKPGTAAKGETSVTSGKRKDEPSRTKDEPSVSGRKSKNDTPKASTKLKPKVRSKSQDGSGKSEDSTPETARRPETDEVGKNKTPRTKPKSAVTPKHSSDSKANVVSSKGKKKFRESENTAAVSDGEVTAGGRKRKRRGRK